MIAYTWQAVQSALYKCSAWLFVVIDKLESDRRNIVGVERRKDADLNRASIFSAFELDVHPLAQAKLDELIGIGKAGDRGAFD